MAPLKDRCYTALLKSPLLHGNIFTKSYKAQILIWHLFYEAQILFWQLFIKAQNTILAKTITLCSKPKTISWQNLKFLAHEKYKLLISQEYFSQQNLWELCLFFHNQLTTKAHVHHPWQNSSFCRDNQAQRSSTTKSS